MLKLTFSNVAFVAFLLSLIGAQPLNSGGWPHPNLSTVVTGEGVLFACPHGDGDLLSAKGLTITATLRNPGGPLVGFPATDIFLIGCGEGLEICMVPPFTTGTTDINGRIVLDGRISASGCDNSGLRFIPAGIFFPTCLPIQTRTPDLKTSGAGACGGEFICPDGKVDSADFAYFATHFPSAANPGATYLACLDIAEPYGTSLGGPDLARFAVHMSGNHACAGERIRS